MNEHEDLRKELILNLKKGENGAFRELFNLYGPRIYRFALAYLKNKPEAEELVQDVFLKIWEKRDHLDPSQNVKAYIYKIAVNCIYDYIRKKNLEKAFADFSKQNFQPGSESLWHEVIWNDMLSNLNILVDKMPEQRRIIFLLRMEEGLTNQQIADKLNLSKRTVENQIFRATRFLKSKLGSETVFMLLFLFLYF
jgi:RNA polymerase sigma-70 factor (family 1)